MKNLFIIFFLTFFFTTKLFCQLDTAAFRKIPGDLHCCTDDSTELLKDTLIIPKYSAIKSPYLLNLEKNCVPIDPAPYFIFQPNDDSILFVYGFSQGKNTGESDEDNPEFKEKILVLRGTWQYGKNNYIVEADFPAWKMNLTWQVEERRDCWLFVRVKK